MKQAIRYFLSQTYPEKELIIVDDSAQPTADLVPDDARIRYRHLDAPTSLGRKLNLGIEDASGSIIQKLDDDDYYHPHFLTTTVGTLRGRNPQRAIVGFESFLVLIAATGALKFSGHGWFAGGTFCFHRTFWEEHGFRDVPRAVDWWFLNDHDAERIPISRPELYILVRHHAGHTWARMGKMDVTQYFTRQSAYRKPLRAVVPSVDVSFYESLRRLPGIETP